MTSAYLTGPFSHILLRARHHGDASRDSHRSATREHCQCAAGRCRGGHVWRGSPRPLGGPLRSRGRLLGLAGKSRTRWEAPVARAPPARGWTLSGKPRPLGCHAGRTRAPPRSRGLPRPCGCHAGRTRAPPQSCGLRRPCGRAAPPTMGIVSARAVKRCGPPLNVWSRFASFPRCASRLH